MSDSTVDPTVFVASSAGGEIRRRTPWQLFWERFREEPVLRREGAPDHQFACHFPIDERVAI